ncbi:MAG: class I SAM-dependent DNA methyltransferase, partial [Selenomonadaceae bacterium]|nr:class I SAM-dependent DNA methyltransferase [Selenomonadaceae bacterium]
IKNSKKNRKKNLLDFQNKLANLKFFDPACGSGNFLTESFISLRRLENEILKELLGEKILLGEFANPIKVSINQFYGIEINDFAVSVAQTALWIAELQTIQTTQEIIHRDLNFLPLKSYANIFEGNALRMDWKNILPNDINFIFGNPPFVGFTFQTDEQKKDLQNIFPKTKNLDYVCAWYKLTSDFIQGSKIQCAFVSTNSITQGETVPQLWKFLNVHINFAHRTFKWQSESFKKVAVHCVILGFANFHREQKIIFDDNKKIFAQNINGYLLDAPNILIVSRNKTLCNVPQMVYGNKPADGGNLILSEEEKNILEKNFPDAKKFIRPLLGAEEFLHNKKRFCLWLVGANPSEIKKIPPIFQRVQLCKEKREQSIATAIRKFAETPTLFAQITQPEGKNFILIPRVSSEKRNYIPINFLTAETKVTDAVQIIPDAEIYHFGILTSSVHMIWTKNFCGRLKSDFRYSKDIVYNNFIWCSPSESQLKKIEQTAQNILDVRKKYPESSLADLYDPILMPKDLRDAHKKNDLAVLEAYGFDKNFSENEIVAELMKLYQNFCGE